MKHDSHKAGGQAGSISVAHTETLVSVHEEEANTQATVGGMAQAGPAARSREWLEGALRESERRFAALFQDAPFALVLSAPPEYRVTQVNEAFLHLFGFARDEVIGKTAPELGIMHDPRAHERIAHLMKERDAVRDFEYSARNSSGGLLHLSLNVNAVTLDGERYVLTAIQDITERKRVEQEAREHADQLQAIFDTVADPLFVYDAAGQLLRANTAARHLLPPPQQSSSEASIVQREPGKAHDYQVRDVTGRPMPRQERPLSRFLGGETIVANEAAEISIHLPDGRDVVLSFTGAPLRDSQGRVTGIVSSARDITERKRLERRTREALDALLEMAAAMVLSPGADGSYARQTAQAGQAGTPLENAPQDHREEVLQRLATLCCRVLGSTRVVLMAVEPETEVLRPLAVTGASAEHALRWRSGFGDLRLADRFSPKVSARLRDGEPMLIELDAMPRGDPAHILSNRFFLLTPMLGKGTLAGYLGVNFGDEAHDYTPESIALAQAVAQLVSTVLEREQLLKEAAEARGRELALAIGNAAKDEFLSIAAHELRTPLTSAKTNLQIAARRLARALVVPETDAAAALSLLQSVSPLLERGEVALNRLGRLVDDLLDVSRIQAGKLELRPKRMDLVLLAREATEEAVQSWPDREVQLEGRLRRAGGSVRAPAQPLWVEADPDRLHQVVANFVSNALKYAPPGHPIAVRLEVAGAKTAPVARIAVRDAGPGLSLAQQAHLFERFYRVDGISHQQNSGIGLGLGLYISRTIVEQHGGRVGVASTPGAGSTFWFELPLEQHAR